MDLKSWSCIQFFSLNRVKNTHNKILKKNTRKKVANILAPIHGTLNIYHGE